ncbi:hypothetical protein B4U78_007545 [Microbacterium esteraromaticum]|nr:hypothetical protein B4U78_007545 [Microbacterium esteraromaticum]
MLPMPVQDSRMVAPRAYSTSHGLMSPSLKKIISRYTGTQARHLPTTPALSKIFIMKIDETT